MQVKICGITSLAEIEMLNRQRPEYAGFILDYPKSRRFITRNQLEQLASHLDPAIRKVGVFTRPDANLIQDLFEKGLIDMAQLHMPQDPKLISTLQQQGIPIIQVYMQPDAKALQQANTSKAQFILFDAGKGEGKAFDWSILNDCSRPFFLAGGLQAKDSTKDPVIYPANTICLDVSSSVETNHQKDEMKIRAFIQAARMAGQKDKASCSQMV